MLRSAEDFEQLANVIGERLLRGLYRPDSMSEMSFDNAAENERSAECWIRGTR